MITSSAGPVRAEGADPDTEIDEFEDRIADLEQARVALQSKSSVSYK